MVKVDNKTKFNINHILCSDYKDDFIYWEKTVF